MSPQDRDSMEQVGRATGGKQNIIPLLQAKTRSLCNPVTNIKHATIVCRKEMGLQRFRRRAGCSLASPESTLVAFFPVDRWQDIIPDLPQHP